MGIRIERALYQPLRRVMRWIRRPRSPFVWLVVGGLLLSSLAGALLLVASTNSRSAAHTQRPSLWGPAPFPIPPVGPVGLPTSTLPWVGDQVISSTVTYRNTSIFLAAGDLTIAAGGSLILDNDTLNISLLGTSGPSALSHGLIVQSGGNLSAKYSILEGGNGSLYPAYVRISGAADFLHTGFVDLGGSGSSPVSGKEGVDVRSAHVTFRSVVFNQTFQVLFSGRGALGDSVDSSAWVDSTISGGSVGWVEVSGGASWTNLTHDTFAGAEDAGMLALVSGPHVTISNSSFLGDPSSTQWSQIYLTYDGATDTGTDASYATFLDNRLQTANLAISDGAYYTVDGNWINDTGHWSDTGGQAAVLVVTWLGSGVGQWTRHLSIEGNTLSNFTHYAIRVSQNVSDLNVSTNRIFDTKSTYTNAISEADGIYLIRGVNNGTVWNNQIDMTDSTQPSEPTNGIVLEAQVNDVNVSGNQVYNCSEVGITVQGDSGALWAPSFYLGPSLRNVLYGNQLVNFHDVSAQSMYSTEAIETWMWANFTRVVNNVIRGWSEVNSGNYWNGAGILTSSSGQWIAGNSMVDVRFGFVFEKFDGAQEIKRLGSFNRSYNWVESNSVSQVKMYTLAENAEDDMGPAVNLLAGPLDPAWSFWFSGSNATLRVVNGELTSLNSSSPYRVSNIVFAGAVRLLNTGTTYDFDLGQWSGPVATIDYASFRQLIPVTAGTYVVTVTQYSSTSDAVAWSSAQGAAASNQLEFNAVHPGTGYSFEVDGASQANFTATSTTVSINWTGNGSHQFALQVLTSGPPPTPLAAEATGTPLSGVAPITVQLSANATGGVPPYSFSWVLGDGSSASGASVSHRYLAAGTFVAQMTVDDFIGLAARASVTVSVSAPVTPALTVTASVNLTEGEVGRPVELEAAASGGTPPIEFTWDTGDLYGPWYGGSVSHIYGSSGAFNATVSAQDAHRHAAAAWVLVHVAPALSVRIAFGSNPTAPATPTSVDAVLTGGVGPETFTWAGSGVGGEHGQQLHFSSATPGDFAMSVTVVDSLGAVATALATLTVGSPSTTNASPSNFSLGSPVLFGWGILPLLLIGGLLTLAVGGVALAARSRRRTSRSSDARTHVTQVGRREDERGHG